MNTRVTNKIQVDESFFNEVVILNTKQRIKEAIKKFDVLKKEIENLIKKSNWIKIGNKDVYYESTENVIVPNLKTFVCGYGENKRKKFEGFKGELPSEKQILNIFTGNFKLNIFYINSCIINGNGEFIKLVFAAESTVNVKSCNVSDISLFLLLLAKYVYDIINAYNIIDGIINFVFCQHIVNNKINIITKYILVLDTKLSKIFLLLVCINLSFYIFYFTSKYSICQYSIL